MKSKVIRNVEAIDKELITEISKISKYTLEEAEAIWYECPYYLVTHIMINGGASINMMAKFILRKLKDNKS